MKNLQLLLFDLDGTLIDSGPDIAAAVNRLLAYHDLRPLPEAEIITYVGRGVRLLLSQVFAVTGSPKDTTIEELYKEFVAFYQTELTLRTRPYPGVLPTLERLSSEGYTLGICTNKPVFLAKPILEHLGLAPFFRCLVGGDTLPVRKPDPAPVLYAIQSLHSSPEQTLLIGDSTYDILAGKAAGVWTCAVTYGYQATPILLAEQPHTLLHDFPALLPLLSLSS